MDDRLALPARAARRGRGQRDDLDFSLIGITLAVLALIATLAVRAGFRAEFVDTILGANAHVTVYSAGAIDDNGAYRASMPDYAARAAAIRAIPGVTRAAPLVRGPGHADRRRPARTWPRFTAWRPKTSPPSPASATAETSLGDLARFGEGIAIGSGLARELGVAVGDRIRMISPYGVKPRWASARRVSSL